MGRKAPDGRTIESSTDFAKYLLEGVGVSVVPGVAFELDPYVRLSYAVSMAELEEVPAKGKSVWLLLLLLALVIGGVLAYFQGVLDPLLKKLGV